MDWLRKVIKGRERLDPEGYPCRIGALWTRLFLKNGWAMVAGRRIWFRNEATYQLYLKQPFWRAHEHRHLWQEQELFNGSTIRYVLAFVWQYIRYLAHDRAPLEIDADAWAREWVEKRDHGNPIDG